MSDVDLDKYAHWAARAEDKDTFVAVEWQDAQAMIAKARAAPELVGAARMFIELETGYDLWGTEAQARFDALQRAVETYDNAKFREDD